MPVLNSIVVGCNWPVCRAHFVTRDPHDPGDMTQSHGMRRSLLRTIHDEFTTIAFYSLQSGINVMGDWVLLSK